MTTENIKDKIDKSLKAFALGNLTANGLALFKTLGYITDRQSPLPNTTFKGFKDAFIDIKKIDEEKARVKEWSYVDLLFQLSKVEVPNQNSSFDTKQVDNTIIETYLFFVIELSNEHYSRTELSLITREVNRLFPMPAMILFKYANTLTLSIINRRLHKKDYDKDVLEKVTLIKDINILAPHRAHLEILFDLSFDELKQKQQFTNFVELHNAWQKTLDTKALNKKFYNELANWYFWATQIVEFPDGAEKDRDLRNATGVIRLITRLIFVWFLKEKKLISDDLFDKEKLKSLLKYADKNNSTYYKAILQNLFFATLNTEMQDRRFRSKNKDEKQRDRHYFIHNVFRYENEFVNPQKTFEKYFSEDIPFLNGGLFECLDTESDTSNDKKGTIRIDGFSDRDDNVLKVPDEIFFTEKEKIIDLSKIYGSEKKNKVNVRGLIDILNSYKFTIAENTPIEEEVALDPELLGKVFENLLASFNPETKTTARNQTGSFYTPREIVDYMVEESLFTYLKKHMGDNKNTEKKLRELLSYSENESKFSEFSDPEKKQLIEAIDKIKIIDPACGSGAFPMGILHKLVHALHKLDPRNKMWKQRQIEKAERIDDPPSRDTAIKAIEEAFENNELDYGRKLYLIENCIYGVDIQPIAVQISKLRFFISLIVHQKTSPEKKNIGVSPLPNLETKFVAANTLMELLEEGDLFMGDDIVKKKEELQLVRHDYFGARNPKKKEDCRKKDKELRTVLAKLLVTNHNSKLPIAKKLADWNPYNQNSFATFFNMEWMYGLADGFDIVIGNPPYIQIQKFARTQTQIDLQNQGYKTFEKTGDIYSLFYEKGINLLKDNGILCYITSNKWMRAGYGKSLREFFIKWNPILLIDLGGNVFESATVDTNILLLQKSKNKKQTKAVSIKNKDNFIQEINNSPTMSFEKNDGWFIGSNVEVELKKKIEKIGMPLREWDVKIYRGVLTGLNEAFIINHETRDKLIAENPKSEEIIKPILRGKDIKKYTYQWAGLFILATGFDINVPKQYPAVYNYLKQFKDKAKARDDKGKDWWNLRSCSYYPEFEKEKMVYSEIVSSPQFLYDDSKLNYVEATSFLMTGKNLKYICAILNSKGGEFLFKNYYAGGGLGEKGYRYKKVFLEQLPIPPITTTNEKTVSHIESLVEKILAKKKNNPDKDTKDLEKEIDQLVYKLYELTYDEVKIIDPEITISKKEYAAIKLE